MLWQHPQNHKYFFCPERRNEEKACTTTRNRGQTQKRRCWGLPRAGFRFLSGFGSQPLVVMCFHPSHSQTLFECHRGGSSLEMQPQPSPPALTTWPDRPSPLPACCWVAERIGARVGKHNAEAHHAQEKTDRDSRAGSCLQAAALLRPVANCSSPPTAQSLPLCRLLLIRLFYCNTSSLSFLLLLLLPPISRAQSTHPLLSEISLPVPQTAQLNRAKQGISHHKTEITNAWLRT